MKRRTFWIALVCLLPLQSPALESNKQAEPDAQTITSRIETTEAGERILVHEVLIDASVDDVWRAHTTDEDWALWSSPQVEIDLRVGGTIRTHYDESATLGDPGTNTLHIVNYVPRRLLTLKADISENWPEVLKQDGDRLTNVILFEALGEERTRLTSYGIGYRDTPEYDNLMKFFIGANEHLYSKLLLLLESK